MRAIIYSLGFALCTALSGCGDTTGEQAIYGAGAGALGSALLDGNLVTGAAVGAAANVIYCKENPSKC
ncbi:hypothetical protein [Pseudophaeobacter leonis]|uniref:hypothetical protein n=1 Tax=Pseudophaeobacter leonis TaxID=1144477 RepID=UPI0009F39B36|nr:hypothetical protein [Pseudophaeobacter leonis]